MKLTRHIAGVASLLVTALGTTAPVTAQELTSGEGVMDRPRPEYDAKGWPIGNGFRLFPLVDVNAGYDDNVLRLSSGVKSSAKFEEKGGLDLRSEWGRHFFEIFGNVDALQYSSLGSEDNFNWSAGGDGRLDLADGLTVTGVSTYSIAHEPRNSPELPLFAAHPTRYANFHGGSEIQYHPFHFGFTVGGTFDRYVYDPTKIIAGPPSSNADRNEDVTDVYAKASYEFTPGYSIFARGDYDTRGFDVPTDRNGFHRASTGYALNGGVDMQLTHLLSGELFAGYLDHHFHAPLPNISGLDFGAKLDWYPTELVTVHLNAARTITDTTIFGAAGADNRSVGLSADWELMRNVIVQPSFSYTDSKYQGSLSGRDDKYTDAGLAGIYMLNRYLSADLKYRYETRSSTLAGQGYNDNLVSVGLTLHP